MSSTIRIAVAAILVCPASLLGQTQESSDRSKLDTWPEPAKPRTAIENNAGRNEKVSAVTPPNTYFRYPDLVKRPGGDKFEKNWIDVSRYEYSEHSQGFATREQAEAALASRKRLFHGSGEIRIIGISNRDGGWIIVAEVRQLSRAEKRNPLQTLPASEREAVKILRTIGGICEFDDDGHVVGLEFGLGVAFAKGDEFQTIQHLKRLRVLNLAGIHFKNLNFLKENAALEELNLSHTGMNDSNVAGIAVLKDLRQLDLRHTRVLGEGLKHLAGLAKLESLSLDEHVGDAGMIHVGKLKNLRHLSLANSRVGDDGLRELAKLKHLETLVLSRSRVTDAGLGQLTEMGALRLRKLIRVCCHLDCEQFRSGPPTSFIENISQQSEIHPISVYWLIREGIVAEGWRCLPEERRIWSDQVTVCVLQLLGHRWATQMETDDIQDGADADGIIPLTSVVGELTLIDRLVPRMRTVEVDEAEFMVLIGQTLADWLVTKFFAHHTRQFKKRPIAWHLHSGDSGARNAFACVVYHHKVDADALPKIRSQYVGPLRQRMETEHRGITSVSPDARTERQEQRRVELDDAVAELQEFDAALQAIITSGFGPKSLIPNLRQYGINDAMLALKSRWLRRLSELIEKTSLTKWLNAADRSGLHPELADWIEDAMTHLNHFCASVGPEPPNEKELEADPTSRDLADLVRPHMESMLTASLTLACHVWWNPFEKAVLKPLKDEVKQLKAEQKECQAALKADPAPSPNDARELKARVKEIKAEVKKLNAKIAEKAKPAQAIREQIEDWRSDEPRTWGDWLAEQPLFDQISGLDERRSPPATIAEFIAQESLYAPDINDGVRVNIAPLQKAGVLAADVLAKKDVDKAIADRAEWRSDERRWVRQGKLPQPGWWPEEKDEPWNGIHSVCGATQ